MASPYSKQDWLSLPTGKKGFKTYQNYINWWGKNVAPKFSAKATPKPFDYLAPVPPADLMKQAQAAVNAQIQPLINNLNKQFTTRQAQGTTDIKTATSDFLNFLGPIATHVSQSYDKSIEDSKALNAGLESFVKGAGANLLGDVTSQAQAAGAPAETTQYLNQNIGGVATGAQAALLGEHAANLDNLIASRGANLTYANQLPVYAAQEGAQGLQKFLTSTSTQHEADLGDLQSQIPGIASQLYDTLLGRETEKAISRKGFALDTAKAKAAAQPQAPKFSSGASKTTGYLTDEYGNPYLDSQGNPIPVNPKVYGSGSKKGAATKYGPADTAYKSALKSAQDIHASLMKKLQGYVSPLGVAIPGIDEGNKGARTAAIKYARANATAAVTNALRAGHPNWSEKQLTTAAAQVLTQAQFPGAANDLAGGNTRAPAAAAKPGSKAAAAPTGHPLWDAARGYAKATLVPAFSGKPEGAQAVKAKNDAFAAMMRYITGAARRAGIGVSTQQARDIATQVLHEVGLVPDSRLVDQQAKAKKKK